jgi:hypothetical protein
VQVCQRRKYTTSAQRKPKKTSSAPWLVATPSAGKARIDSVCPAPRLVDHGNAFGPSRSNEHIKTVGEPASLRRGVRIASIPRSHPATRSPSSIVVGVCPSVRCRIVVLTVQPRPATPSRAAAVRAHSAPTEMYRWKANADQLCGSSTDFEARSPVAFEPAQAQAQEELQALSAPRAINNYSAPLGVVIYEHDSCSCVQPFLILGPV